MATATTVRPADTQEKLAISWICKDMPVPENLQQFVSSYCQLAGFRDSVADPAPIDRVMDMLYDQLVAAAACQSEVS